MFAAVFLAGALGYIDKMITLKSIDSTNNYLKRNYVMYGDWTVVVSGVQKKGRGRKNRK